MGFFGRKRVTGITQHELKHEYVQSRLDSVFPANRSSSKMKRAALHTALSLALDRDTNMGSGQKHGIIQPEEFETAVHGLESGGIISSQEAEQLRKIAEKPLSD